MEELLELAEVTSLPYLTLQNNGTDNSTFEFEDENVFHGVNWTAARIQRVITLSLLFLVSLIGNSVIIIILACARSQKRRNRSRVHIYILHLSLSDLAVCCITMTSELILEIYGEWKIGWLGCKLVMYTEIVTLSATTYILMAMSWDRYQAICRPLDFNPSPSKAQRMVLIAWWIALISSLPYFFIYVQVPEGRHPDGTVVFHCNSVGYSAGWLRKLNFVWLTLSVLIFPAIWISYCYFNLARVVWQQGNCQQTVTIDGSTSLRKTCDIRIIPRAKIKTMKMSLIIVITFVVCWTPYFVVYNIRIFSDYTFTISESVMVIADTLALMNSAVNPIIYGFFNLRVRQGLREACCFNINVQADKSQMSEPSASTSSTIHLKSVRRTSGQLPRSQRKYTSGETGFDFAQSTRHIQNNYYNKLMRDYGHSNRYVATSRI